MRLEITLVTVFAFCMLSFGILITVSVALGVAHLIEKSRNSNCVSETISHLEAFSRNKTCRSHPRWTDGAATIFDDELIRGCALYDAMPERCAFNIKYAGLSEDFDTSLVGVGPDTACCACGGDEAKASSFLTNSEEFALHAYRLENDDCVFAVDDMWIDNKWRGLGDFDATDWKLSTTRPFQELCSATSVDAVISSRCLGDDFIALKTYEMIKHRLIERRTNATRKRLVRNISWMLRGCSASIDDPAFDMFVSNRHTKLYAFEKRVWQSVSLPAPERQQIVAMIPGRFSSNVGRVAIQNTIDGKLSLRLGLEGSPGWYASTISPPTCDDNQWRCTLFYGSYCFENSVRIHSCVTQNKSRNPLGLYRRCAAYKTSPGFCVGSNEYVELIDAYGDGWNEGYLHCSGFNQQMRVNLPTKRLELVDMCHKK